MVVRRERAPSSVKGEVEVEGEEKGRRADVDVEEAAA